jgi:hypothetical protein
MSVVKNFSWCVCWLAVASCTRPTQSTTGDAVTTTESPASTESDLCQVVTRLREPVLLRLHDDDTFVPEGLACRTPACISGGLETRVVRDGDHLAVRVGAQELVLDPRTSPLQGGAAGTDGVLVTHDLAVIDRGATWDLVSAHDDTRTIPAPSLAAGELVTGVQHFAGGVRARVSRHRADDGAWRLWLVPPTVTLPSDGGALLDEDHKLVGTLVAGDPARLVFNDGEVVPLGAAFTAEAQVGTRGGLWMVRERRRAVAVARHGAPLQLAPGAQVRVLEHSFLVVQSDRLGRLVLDDTGVHLVPVTTLIAGHDLAGAPLPAGVVHERLEVASDSKHRVLVAERLRTLACDVEDRVHMVDVDTGAVKTLVRGPGARVSPVFASGAFYVVQARVELENP